MKHIAAVLACVSVVALAAPSARAANYTPPASGLLIQDLAGTPMLPGYTQYTSSFVGSSASSTVTFVFRHDPGFFGFDDAAVTDVTHPGTNLLTNGSFDLSAPMANGAGAPGWQYFQQNGVTYLGQVAPAGTAGNAAHTGANFWNDGATEGYDGLTQTFPTAPGDTYRVSFYLTQSGGTGYTTNNLYQAISTNGRSGTAGNGIDVLVYAGNGLPPTSVPEPGTIGLLGAAVLGLGLVARRRVTGAG